MKKARNAILYVLSLLTILSGIATAKIETYAAEGEEELAINVAILDDILTSREYVLKTFATDKDSFKDTGNPYALAYGVSGHDYMYKELMDRYENNTEYKALINVYYMAMNPGDSLLKIPAELAELFSNEDYSSLVNCAEQKAIDGLLNQIVANDYETSFGTHFSDEYENLEKYRGIQDSVGKVNSFLSSVTDWSDVVADIADDEQMHYVEKILPDYGVSAEETIQELLGIVQGDTGSYHKFLKVKDTADGFGLFGFDSEDQRTEWKRNLDIQIFNEKLSKYAGIIGDVTSTSNALIQDAVLMESMINQKDSLVDTMSRIGDYAKNGDEEDREETNLGYKVALDKYISMLNSMEENSLMAICVKEGLAAIESELSKYVWNQTKEKMTEVALRQASETALSEAVAKATIAKKAASCNLIYTIVKTTADMVVDLGTSSEKIFELCRLRDLKKYTLGVYENDLYAYQNLKIEGASLKEQDEAAAKVLNDLDFLKRITLLQNDLGCAIQTGMASKGVVQFMKMMDGYDYEANIKEVHTQIMDALIETNIYELYHEPLVVKSGETFVITDTKNITVSDEKYGRFEREGQIQYVLDIEKRLAMGGIILERGAALQVDTDIFIYTIDAQGANINIADDALLETMEYSASNVDTNGITGNLHVRGDFFSSGPVSMNGEMGGDTADIRVDGDLEIQYNVSTGRAARLAVGNVNVEIGGNFMINKNAEISNTLAAELGLAMNHANSKVLVHGDTWFYGNNTYNDPDLNNGTLEMKGDLYGRGTYSTCWVASEDFHMIFSGEEVQTIDIEGDGFNGLATNHYPFGRLSVTGVGISINKPLRVKKLETDIVIADDLKDIKVDDFNNKKVTVLGELDLERSHLTINSGELHVAGDVLINNPYDSSYQSSITITGGCLRTGGNLYVDMTRNGDGTGTEIGKYLGNTLTLNDANGKLFVEGDCWLGGMVFKDGSVELQGDIKGNWTTYPEAEFTFSGSRKQTIAPESVSLSSEAIIGGLGNLKVTGAGIQMEGALGVHKLNSDMTVDGNLSNIIVLNGGDYTLTLNGNLLNTANITAHLSGNVIFNGDIGEASSEFYGITVEDGANVLLKGNNYFEALTINGGTITFEKKVGSSSAKYLDYLKMNSPEAKLIALDDFYYNGKGDYLTQGILEFYGGAVYFPYQFTGAKVHIGGNKSGIVQIDSSKFLSIKKYNNDKDVDFWIEKTGDGYFLTVGENCAPISEMKFRQETTPYLPLNIQGNLTVNGDVYSYFDVNIEDSLTVEDMYVRGYSGASESYVRVYPDATLTVNGNLNQYQDDYARIKYLQVDGTAIVHGNMLWADSVHTNNLCFGKNYGLIMQNDNSSLTVKGNLSLGENNILTKGIIRVAGNYNGPTETEGTVIKQVLSSIALTEEAVNLNYGDTKELILSTQPTGFDTSTAVWSSSDSSIVEVEQGVLTAKKVGTAVITVELDGCTDSCNVTVVPTDLSNYRVDGKDGIIYTDSELIADLSVYNNANEMLTENVDYTLETQKNEVEVQFIIRGINNYGGEIIFTIAKAYVEKIVIDTEAGKNIYEVGEVFDSTGLRILAVYSNGYTKDVTEQVTFYQEALTADMDKIVFTYAVDGQEFNVEQQITVFEAYSGDASLMGVVADGTVGVVAADADNTITLIVQPEAVITVENITVIANSEYAMISSLQLVEDTENQYLFTITAQDGSENDYILVIVNADDMDAYETAKETALEKILDSIEMIDLEEGIEWTQELIIASVVAKLNDNPIMKAASQSFTADTVQVTQFVEPIHGNADELEGTDGSYQVQIIYGRDSAIYTFGGTLAAKNYEGVPNTEVLKTVKDTLQNADLVIESASLEEGIDILDAARQLIIAEVNAQNVGVEISEESIVEVARVEAEKGTVEYPEGRDGYITLNVTLQKGNTQDTLYGLRVAVKTQSVEVVYVTVTVEGAGSSDKLGKNAVIKGENFRAEFTPVKGWQLKGYRKDGSYLILNTSPTYELSNVQSDITLTAVFETEFPYPATIVLEQTQWECTGEEIEPRVTVLDALGKPMSPTDYTVEYENNFSIGTAIVRVVFKGVYRGSVETTFEIIPATYQVHFDSAGGTPCESITVTQRQPYGTLPTTEREGFEFEGWWNEDSWQFVDETTIVLANASHTLTAIWEGHWYEVCLDSNGAGYMEWIMCEYGVPYGLGLEYAVPEMAGATFQGWYTEKEGGEQVTADTIMSIAADHTLYARWEYTYKTETPVTDVENGSQVEKGTRVKLSSGTNGAEVYYIAASMEEGRENVTHSAAEIIEQGTLYEDAIVIETPVFLEAVAVKAGYQNSDVVAFSYTVKDNSQEWGDVLEEDKDIFTSPTQIPEDYWVAGVEETISYEGKAITFPNIRLYYHKTLLTEKVDYTLKYANNTNAGIAKITFTGKGNYSGSCVWEFNITPLDLGKAKIEQPVIMVKFNNKVQKKTNKVTYDINGKTVTLKVGKDFTYEYPKTDSKDIENYEANAFKEPGDYTVILKGKGNYTGEISFITSIKDATLVSALKYTVKGDSYKGGEPVEPTTLIVKNGKAVLKGCKVSDAEEAAVTLESVKNSGEKTEYDYIYYLEDNTEIGNAKITFIGIEEKGYAGIVTKTYLISGKALKSAKIKFLASSYSWNGEAVDPFVSAEGREAANLLYGTETLFGISKEIYDAMPEGEALTEGTDTVSKRNYDYVYELSNNQNIGTASVVITGVNEFSGTVKKTFKITGKSISSVKVDGVNKAGYDYISSAVEIAGAENSSEVPEGFKVYFAKTNKTEEIKLDKGVDYTISYQKNENRGNATLILTGINGYTGTKKVSFKINAYKMSPQENRIQIDLVDSDGKVSYQKNGSKPEMIVTDTLNGKQLVLNKDYTVKYKNNNEVGNAVKKPTITITGKGNYAGSKEEYFIIESSSLENTTMTAKDIVFKDKSNIYKSAVTLVDSNGVKLAAGKDYDKNVDYTYVQDSNVMENYHGWLYNAIRREGEEVQSVDVIPVGTQIKATVNGIGNYANTQQSVIFTFVTADISKATVTVSKQNYTGKEVQPTKADITVTLNKQTLKKTDYEIVGYSNNIKQGKGKITLKGIGNYGGTKTVDFVIQKKALWLDIIRGNAK